MITYRPVKETNIDAVRYARSPLYPMFEAFKHLVGSHQQKHYRVYFVAFKFDNKLGATKIKRKKMLRKIEHKFYPALIKYTKLRPGRSICPTTYPVLFEVPDVSVE